MTTLDSKVIREISHANPTSEALFLALSLRERNRSEIDLDRTRQELVAEGFKIVRDDLIEAFTKLEKVGVGTLVKAKDGHPTRFKFHFSLKEVAKAGFDGSNVHRLPKQSKSVTANEMRTVVLLSGDRQASFTIPRDLTKEEAERIFKTALLQRA